jgi:hypothetical protein
MKGLLRHSGIFAFEKVSIIGYVSTAVAWIIKASG